MNPGRTALTRIPSSATSRARPMVVYQGGLRGSVINVFSGRASGAAPEDTLTIAPPVPSYF